MLPSDPELSSLYARAKEECPLHGNIPLTPNGFISLLQVLGREAPPHLFQGVVKKITAVFNNLTDESLRNGYIESMADNDITSAMTCLNVLMNKNKMFMEPANGLDVNASSLSTRNVSLAGFNSNGNYAPSLGTVEERNEPENRNTDAAECVVSTSKCSRNSSSPEALGRSRSKTAIDSSSGSESDSENPNEFGKAVYKRHVGADRFKGKSNEGCKRSKRSRHLEYSSDEWFRPATGKVPTSGHDKRSKGRKPKTYRSTQSSSDSEPDYTSEEVVKKSNRARSDRRHRESSLSDSERESRSRVKVKSKKKLPTKPEKSVTKKKLDKKNTSDTKSKKTRVGKPESRHPRSPQDRSPSVSSCSSSAPSPTRQSPPSNNSKRQRKRISLSDSEVKIPTSKSKSRKNYKKNTDSQPSGQKTKNTSTKKSASDQKKSKENQKIKTEQKGTRNPKSTPQDKPLVESQFMNRLKVLESSVIEGKPDPLDKQPAKSRPKGKAAQSTKNKSPGTSKKAVSKGSKIEKCGVSKPSVKNKKVNCVTKAPAKSRTKKVGAVKTKKMTGVKAKVSSGAGKKSKEESAPEGKSKAEDSEVRLENTKEEPSKVDSSFSSDDSCLSDVELEAGGLSSCLNSIKKKISKPLGSATPPLNVFLSTMNRTLSDVSETSSFDRLPSKQDYKSVVKRMARANKPDALSQSSAPPQQLNHMLNEIEQIGKQLKPNESDCDSFSSD